MMKTLCKALIGKVRAHKPYAAMVAIALVVALLVTMFPLHIEMGNPDNSILNIGQGHYRIVIGNQVSAQAANYTCDGTADDVEFQQALDALPAIGGQLFVLAGSYSFNATVTRAIDNVSIIGVGAAVTFANDGSTPIFEAGGDRWVFSNLRTDDGGIDMTGTDYWMWLNIFIGTTFYSVEAPDDPLGGVIATLDDIGDVNVPGPTDQYILYWDNLAGAWQAQAISNYDLADLGTKVLNDLDDLNAGTPSDQYLLYWDNGTSRWKAQALSNYDLSDLGTKELNDLDDVDTTETDGWYIYWDDGNSKWESKALAIADVPGLQDILTGISGNVTTLQGLSHTQGTDTTMGTLTADIDFAGYMAIAMACAQGATMPVAPQTGQWFLHTPTGRKILYQYDGSDWQSIVSLGDVAVYVDKTDGTDDLDYGFGVDGDAFASIQYAVDSIPKGCPGSPSIYINNESYTEDVYVRGTGGWQIPSGIAIYGTLDQVTTGAAMGGTQGATTTTPKVEGTFLANQYDNKLIKFTSGTNNDTYRVIGLTTTTNLCLVGEALTAQPQNGDTYTIYDWGTEIDGLVNIGPLTRLTGYDLAVTRATPSGYGTCMWGWTYGHFVRCRFSTTGSPYAITYAQGSGGLDTCLVSVTGGLIGLQLENMGECEVDSTRFIGDDTADSVGINVIRNSNLASFRYGCEIEGFDKGINLDDCGGYGWSPNVYSNIHGCSYGVYTEAGGQLLHTQYIQFGKELDGNNDATGTDEFKEESAGQIYKTDDATFQDIPSAGWTHVLLDTESYDILNECDGTVVSGTAENIAGANLQDTGMFTEDEDYYIGRSLWNTTDNTYTTVTGKTSDDVLTLTADIMDNGEGYSLYFSRYTASAAGRYLVIGLIAYGVTNTLDGKIYISAIYKNGVVEARNRMASSADAQYVQAQVTTVVSLAIGDYLELWTYHNTGVTAEMGNGLSSVSLVVYKLG